MRHRQPRLIDCFLKPFLLYSVPPKAIKMVDSGSVTAGGMKSGNHFSGFFILYVVLYAAYGTESAYLPAFFEGRGLWPEQIGIVLAAGTIVRIFMGPLIGRLADKFSARKFALTSAAAC